MARLTEETFDRPPWVIVEAQFHFTAGQSKAVAALAEYLAGAAYPVHLVGHSFDPKLASLPGVTTHAVPRVRGTDVVGNLFLARAGQAVARRVRRHHPKAQVVGNGGNCMGADVTWVHYLHHAWAPDLAEAPLTFRLKETLFGAWYRHRERRAIRGARLVLTNSDRTTADVVRHIGVPVERVRTIRYGANPVWALPTDQERRDARKFFGLDANRPVVAFVGGFGYDRRKGFDTLLEAWRIVCQSPEWDAELVMAGEGRAMATWAAWLTQHGLQNRVRMLGYTHRVFELLAASDLLVSPVHYEPYGLNVQEALCRGVPAIVSAVAGVADDCPPELADMLLSDANDPNALAECLRCWRADPVGWRQRITPLSERLRSRGWDDMAREIVAVVRAS